MTRAARPRTSSAGSGFFLFGMIDDPVEKASRRPDEPEARVRPPRDLLGQPAEVDHPEGDRGERLDDEVPVADGIERVGGHAVEPELRGRGLAIERVAGPGQRPGTERRDVGPSARIGQPAPVALRHLDVGEEVMGEQHRLRRLDVGRPGQHRGALALGERDERPLEVEQRAVQSVDRPAEPQPKVGGDLVVARAAGVQLAGDGSDPVGQRRLEVEVDVLERGVPLDRAGRDGLRQAGQAADQLVDLVVGQESRTRRARGRGRSSPRCRRPPARGRARSSA